MQCFGLATLGRDAEIRRAGSGDAVCSLSLAFSYYDKNGENGRSTQWVDGALWGKRAESLAQYLTKGQKVSVTLDDVHVEEYAGRNGTATKLVGRVSNIELAGKKPEQAGSGPTHAAPPAPAARTRQAPARSPAPAADDFDDLPPF